MGRQSYCWLVSVVRNVALGDCAVTRSMPVHRHPDVPAVGSSSVRSPWCAPCERPTALLQCAGAAALSMLRASTRGNGSVAGRRPGRRHGIVPGDRPRRSPTCPDGRPAAGMAAAAPAASTASASAVAVAVCRAQGARGAIARLVPLICSYVRFSSPDGGRGFCRRPRGAELWGQRPRRGRQPRGARDGRSTTDHHR